MLADFLNFVLSVFRMIVSLFESTDLGGFTYDKILVAIFVIGLIINVLIVRLR